MDNIVSISTSLICVKDGLCIICGRTKWLMAVKNPFFSADDLAFFVATRKARVSRNIHKNIVVYNNANYVTTDYFCVWCNSNNNSFDSHTRASLGLAIATAVQTKFTDLLLAEYKTSIGDNEKLEIMAKLLGKQCIKYE